MKAGRPSTERHFYVIVCPVAYKGRLVTGDGDRDRGVGRRCTRVGRFWLTDDSTERIPVGNTVDVNAATYGNLTG